VGTFKVHQEDSDDTLSKVRRLRLDVRSKQVYTPRRALNLSPGDYNSESKLIKNKKVRGINETYKLITKQKLEDNNSDPESDAKFGRTLRFLSNPAYGEEFNLLIFSYENKDSKTNKFYNTIPSSEEIQRICETIVHPSSDVIVPPRISGLSGIQYCDFLDLFFDQLKSHSFDQTIFGFVPFVARNELPNLFDLYKKYGITSFVVDFESHNPIDVYALVGLIHRLSQQISLDYSEDVYLHGLNIPFTRIKNRIDVTPAKDIVTLTMGFDSFGSTHLPDKLPLEVVQKIKEKMARAHSSYGHTSESNIGQVPEVFRIFNRADYGYYRSDIPNLIFGDESDVSINFSSIYVENISREKRRGIRKGFNVERQALEAVDLQRVILEDSLLPYLENKKHARDIVKRIASVNSST